MSKKFDLDELEVFPWNDSFNTGIKEIDHQHKILVELLNELANKLTKDETSEIERTFSKLAEYADFHFKSEEKIWDKYLHDTDIVIKHKKSHESFLPKVLEIYEKNKDEEYHIIIGNILIFLIRWLAFHIIDDDKRLALVIENINKGNKLEEAQFRVDNIMNGSMKTLIDAILSMHSTLSLKAITLIKERKARVKAERELKRINKKLEELSITDQLTKLHNRRFYDEIFERELQRARRSGINFNVILFDIDYFKRLNDTYGHLEGDKALIAISVVLRNVFKRPSDFVFRIGGEEFCIIVSNETLENILDLTKQLRESIAVLKIDNKESTVSQYLTISVGIVSKIPDKDDTMDVIVKKVDEQLYLAKDLGRDKIMY